MGLANGVIDRLEQWANRRWTLPMIIAAALAVRIVVMIALPQAPFSDGAYYIDRAHAMLNGEGFSEYGRATAFWPPGMSFLYAGAMAVLGRGLWAAMVVNLIAVAVTIALIWWFARRLTGSGAVALIASVLYAAYPAHIAHCGTLLSETASTALAMAAIAAVWRGWSRNGVPEEQGADERTDLRWLALGGALFGAATLIRAQLLYFPIGLVVALALLGRARDWRRALPALAMILAAALLVILPWSLRNQREMGSFILVSTNGGVALYTGAMPEADGGYVEWTPTIWERSGIPFDQHVVRQIEVDRNFRALAKRTIAADPLHWIALMPRKAFILWAKDGDGFWGLQGSYPRAAYPLLIAGFVNQLFYMVMLILALPCLFSGLAGWLGRPRDDRRYLLILFLMPAFATLTAMVFNGQTRYHFGAMPFLIIAAAWTLARWFGWGRAGVAAGEGVTKPVPVTS